MTEFINVCNVIMRLSGTVILGSMAIGVVLILVGIFIAWWRDTMKHEE